MNAPSSQAVWDALKAMRAVVDADMDVLAQERAEREIERNWSRRMARLLKSPKRTRRPTSGGNPRPIGPKRIRELEIKVKGFLLDALSQRREAIERDGIESVLNALDATQLQSDRRNESELTARLAKNILAEWRVQFAATKPRPHRTRTAMPWSEDAVRSDLVMRRELAKAALGIVPKKPRGQAALRGADELRAECALLERLLGSNHLRSRDRFLQVAEIVRLEVAPPKSCYSSQHYKDCWNYALSAVIRDLSARYTIATA